MTRGDDLWAAAVRETGIWMAPYAEQVADFGRLLIPRITKAIEAAQTAERERCVGIVTATWGADLVTTQAALENGTATEVCKTLRSASA